MKPVRDKYSAVWVSHSSMGDFLKCPRAYYLHNVYKDPKTRRKINITTPALALGVAVHEVVEGLADFPAEKRASMATETALIERLGIAWKKVSGKKGGFRTPEQEAEMRTRAEAMLRRVAGHAEPLLLKTVKLPNGNSDMPPNFYINDEDNIILCGKVDWLIYRPEDNTLHILDFKTGKNEESGESLQLPIYQLLLANLQKRKVNGASYWYIDRDDTPIEVDLPSVEESYKRVIVVARQVAAARAKAALEGPDAAFICPRVLDGSGSDCFACRPFERILRGEAEYIGVGEYNQDLFMLPE
ncbi:MAG: hypothetical protein RIT04_461 [Candidatus Parcubacteria bacterium]